MASEEVGRVKLGRGIKRVRPKPRRCDESGGLPLSRMETAEMTAETVPVLSRTSDPLYMQYRRKRGTTRAVAREKRRDDGDLQPKASLDNPPLVFLPSASLEDPSSAA